MRNFWLLAASFFLAAPLHAQAPSTQEIDIIIKEALAFWNVPGVAIAIVHNDQIYLHGYGVKELGKLEKVTQDTVFPLASCSKALTVTALAMLVDDGKLNWDDPVRKHLPWFKLADPCANANVTLRDLLTHRTGLGKHEALWFRTSLSMEERARRLAFLAPTHGFRATFEYQAIAYGTAGLAGGVAAGSTWQDLMQKRLFAPLDMKNASAVFPGLDKADCASPHKQTGRTVAVVDRYPLDLPDPAGSIHASARDLGEFLRLQLNDGMWKKGRLVAANSLYETQTPQIIIRHEGFARAMNPDSHVLSYTLGWIAQDYRGRWMLMHGGTVDGFRAQITIIPEARLGIALLNNLDRTWMNLALSNTLVDRYCQLPARNWDKHCKEVNEENDRYNQARLKELMGRRKLNTKPSLPLAAYVGVYQDPAYGICHVRLEKDQLRWQWGNVQSKLVHFENDVFMAVDEPVERMTCTFQLDNQGRVEFVRVMERNFRRQP